jgi:site-specific DNA recombinase
VEIIKIHMKFAATYARVSTARQEEEQTIKTQLAAVGEVVVKRGDKLVEEYKDEGWSGDVLARPALDKLRQDAKLKRWQVLVVYDPDRIARRYSYQELVMDELREAGIEVVFVTVSVPKNSEDKILYGVRGLFAEYERAKITERFRMGKLRKAKEGHIMVSQPAYGYRYIPKNDKTHGYYEIDEQEARVVRMIFGWIDRGGLTLRAVVRKLHDLGIKPRKAARGAWSSSTLSSILRNKTYIGEAHWGGSYMVVPEKPMSNEKYRKIRKSSRRMKPEAEWHKIPVPAIIDAAQFYRVRSKISRSFLFSPRNTKNEYLLAGTIHCPCGYKRGGQGANGGKYLYYRCTSHMSTFPLPSACKEPSLNAKKVDEIVWREIAALLSSPENMQSQARNWIEAHDKTGSKSQDATSFLKREIAKLREQEDRYAKAYAAGILSVEQLRDYIAPIRAKASAAEVQIQSLENEERESETHQLPNPAQIASFAETASKIVRDASFNRKKAIVKHVVGRVDGTRERLNVYGSIPISGIQIMQAITQNRSGEMTLVHDSSKNVKVNPDDGYGQDTMQHGSAGGVNVCPEEWPPRHDSDEDGQKLIPFHIHIDISSSNSRYAQN